MPKFRIDEFPPYSLGRLCEAVMEARRTGREVIDLSQFNPDLPPPAFAIEKLVQAAILPHNHRYSASRGITALRSAAAAMYERRFGVSVDPDEEVIVTMGTKEGLTHLLLATLSPGDSVILPTPAYPIHSSAIFISGARSVEVPLWDSSEDAHLTLNAKNDSFFRRLEESLATSKPRPKFVIMSFPHNPTTAVAERDFFDRLVGVARDHELLILHDFAYSAMSYDGFQAPSILQSPEAKGVSIEFFSLSKVFGIPGWRMSFCVGNSKLVQALRRIKSYIDSGAFQPIQIASTRMVEQSERVFHDVSEVYRMRRNTFVEEMERIGWAVAKPRATPFIWAKLPPALAKLGSIRASESILHEANVAVCPGAGFGAAGEGFVRFALAENEQRLRIAIGKIGDYLGKV